MSQEKKIEYNEKHVAFVFDTDSNLKSVLVTEDGNVFKGDAKGASFCKDHCRRLNIEFGEVTRDEFETLNPKKDEVKPVALTKLNKAQLLAICADKGIEANESDKNADLVKLIEDSEKEEDSNEDSAEDENNAEELEDNANDNPAE